MNTFQIALLVVLVAIALTGAARAADTSPADECLARGGLTEAAKSLAARLKETPNDETLRFGLGVVRFVRAVEHLSQSLYRYGLRGRLGQSLGIPVLRLPLPDNPAPEPIDYAASRRILQDLVDDLRLAESTLAGIRQDTVRLPVRLGLIRMDLDGSGRPGLPLRELVTLYMGRGATLPKDPDLRVVFARGDVAWFRGYCHLLMAQAEVALAYDFEALFNGSAHLFFARPTTPYPFLRRSDGKDFYHLGGGVDIIDVIAMIHLVRLPLREPARMSAALQHLEKTLTLSRETWRYVLADTSTDPKWLPNPHQTGVLGVQVTQEMVDGWLAFVDESLALLEGQRLAPFWRQGETRGVNVRRVFTEPRPLDLVEWIQGPAAAPYLETGPLTRPEVWRRLMDVFQGQFIGFAIWFN